MERDKKNRKEYLNDFRKNTEGQYEYKGEYYICEYQGADYRRRLLYGWAASVLLFAAAAVAGNIDAPGIGTGFGNSIYVVIPWLVNLLGGVSVLWTMCRISAGKNPMRAYTYEETIEKLPARAGLTCVFSVASVIAEVIYLCLHTEEGNFLRAVLFCGLELVTFAASLWMLRRFSAIKWTKSSKK